MAKGRSAVPHLKLIKGLERVVGFFVGPVVGHAVVSFCLAACSAPCYDFEKLPDGKWRVLKTVNIKNGEMSVMVNAGTIISPGLRVTGIDIYAALEGSCH